MKKIKLLGTLMLVVMALPFMISCSKDDDGGTGGSNITVVVNENGTTSNGSIFSAIDDKNFYLDYIKYTVAEGHLVVTGYDKAGFKGVANIVSRITYKGNTYEVLEIGNGEYNSSFPGAFHGCRSLTSVSIPNSVTKIGYAAFEGCTGLKSITIPNSVKIIDRGAFYNCSGLTSVTIGNSVTSIGVSAFYGCSGLTSITIPNSVTSIGKDAFSGCGNLSSINITDLAAWCERDFASNPLSYANHLYLNGKEVTNLVIPNGVKKISQSAFAGCSGLTSVTIPESVTSISYGAFSGCSGLSSIKVDGGNNIYDSRDNCNAIIQSSTNTLILGCKNTVIPNSVTSVGEYAFSGCRGMTSVTIPESVTSIGDYTFWDCSGMTSVTIGNGVTSIERYAFYGCSGLKEIHCQSANPPSLGWESYDDLVMSSATLYVPTGSIKAYRGSHPWYIFRYIVEE